MVHRSLLVPAGIRFPAGLFVICTSLAMVRIGLAADSAPPATPKAATPAEATSPAPAQANTEAAPTPKPAETPNPAPAATKPAANPETSSAKPATAAPAPAAKTPEPPAKVTETSKTPPAEEKSAATPAAPPAETPTAPAKATEEPPKPPSDPKLRFNFRFQRWTDVLQWFADQADLSLVLDAPPPGTFNYTDSREYTPSEAIDLLNSVLQSKGYTLIRRERMLMVVDLRGGLPEGLIPRIPLEEAEKRGKFELVSILFALEGRDPEVVKSEISALLGPYGSSVTLPQTQQILVTDRAGVMQTISTVISSIAIPAKPAAPPTPPKPETPELQVYQASHVTPQSVVDVVHLLIPDLKITVDPKTEQIHAYAGPSQQAVVKKVLEQMEAGDPPDRRAKLQLYSLDRSGLSAKEARHLELVLGIAVPEARLRIDEEGGQVVAWGTPAEHETLATTLRQLGRSAALDETRQLEVYRLTQVDPETTLSLFQDLLPHVKLSLDPRTHSLIAVGSPSDHKAIKSLIEQLQPPKSDPGAAQLRVIPLNHPLPENATDFLNKLTPNADVTLDSQNKRLIVVATSAEHDALKSTIEQLETTTSAEEAYQLVVYRVLPNRLARVQSILENLSADSTEPSRTRLSKSWLSRLSAVQVEKLRSRGLIPSEGTESEAAFSVSLAGIKIIPDTERSELAIWAKVSQHQVVAAIVEQLKDGQGDYADRKLTAYNVMEADLDSVLEMLQPLYPDAKIVPDAVNRRLLVWASAAGHESIKKSLEQMTQDQGPEGTRQVEVYRLKKVAAATALSLLQGLFPNAKLSLDTQTQSLIAMAVPADQKGIRATLEQLDPEEPGPNTAVLRFYPLSDKIPKNLTTLLSGLAPEAQLTVDTTKKQLMAVATPADHAIIQSTLENMDKTLPMSEDRQLTVYRVTPAQRKRFEAILSTVTTELPEIKVITDAQPGQISIWATPSEHKTVAQIMEQLKPDGDHDDQYQLTVYPLKSADITSVMAMLESLYPDTKIVSDAAGQRVLVWADPETQASLKKSLEQMQADAPEGFQSRFESYPLFGADPTGLITNLKTLVPNARITVDTTGTKLIAWGTPEDHAQLKAGLKELGQGMTPATTRQLEVYRLSKADPTAVVSLLTQLLPGAQFTVDATTRSLIAVAVPTDHQAIKAMLQHLEPEEPGPNTPQLRFYPLTKELPSSLTTVLGKLVPTAQLTIDEEKKQLVVVATPADHALVKTAIDDMETSLPADEKPQLIVYPVTPAQRTRFEAVLETMTEDLPGLKVIADAQPGELSIWAKPKQHIVIAQVIDQLKRDTPKTERYQLVAYPLTSADPETAQDVLESMFPGTQIVIDENTDRLLIWTRASEHEQIKAAIEQLNSGESTNHDVGFQVFPLGDANPQIALQLLQELLPKVKFVQDTASKSLVAWVKRESDRELITTTLDRLQAGSDERYQPKMMTYSAGSADATTLAQFLQSVVPKARITVDTKTNSLMVWAPEDDQETIKKSVEQMVQQAAGDGAAKVAVYDLPNSGAAAAYSVLRYAFPQMRFTYSASDHAKLIAWGPASDHKMLEQIAKALEDQSAQRVGVELRIHEVKGMKASEAQRLLTTVAPQATFTPSEDPKRLIVWARTEDHAVIEKVLTQLADEDLKKSDLTMEVYSLGKASPTTALQMLQSLLPDVKLLSDTANRAIIAWAKEAEHKQIAQTLEKLDSGPDERHKPTLQIYSVGTADPTAVSTFLRTIAPTAQISPDTKTNSLTVWAKPDDHEVISETIDRMVKQTAAQEQPKVVIYDLPNNGAAAAYSILRYSFPKMSFNYSSSDPTKLIAWGPAADHEMVKQIVEALEDQSARRVGVELKIHEVKGMKASEAQRLLTTVAPKATFTPSADPTRLIVWARTEDHTVIEKVLTQLADEALKKSDLIMEVYSLGKTSPTTALQMLQSLLPDVKLLSDTANRAIIAWAKEDEHKQIAQTLEKLDSGPDERHKPTLQIYSVGTADPTAVSTFLRTIAPTAQITADTKAGTLTVWATPDDHEVIGKTIDQMVKEAADQEPPKVVIYDMPSAGALSAYYLLRSAFPRMQISYNSTYTQLITWGSASDQAIVKQIVEQLEEGTTLRAGLELKVYAIEGVTATEARTVLAKMVPQATLTPSTADPNKLIVWAKPKDHELIEKTLGQLTEGIGLAGDRSMHVYAIRKADTTTALQVLQERLPHVKFLTDRLRGELIAWTSETDDKTITEILDGLQAGPDERHKPTLTVYAVGQADPTTVTSVLMSVVPEAKITVDAKTNGLAIWATPEDHTTIRETIDIMVKQATGESATQVVVYELPKLGSAAAYTILRTAFPTMRFTYSSTDRSKLIAWGSAADQKMVAKTVEQLEQKDSEHTPTLVIYSAENLDPTTVSTFLRTAVPNATVTVESTTGNLMVWASPADHVTVKATLDEMLKQASEGGGKVVIYDLEGTGALTAWYILREAFPRMTFRYSTVDRAKLIAWGSEADHERVKKLVDQLEAEASRKTGLELKVYDVASVGTTKAIQMLSSVVPKAQLTTGTDPDKLIVWAKPDDHAAIENIVSQLPPPVEVESRVYRLKHAEARAAYYALRLLVPAASVSWDTVNNSVVVSATPKDHEKVRDAIDDMEQPGAEYTPILVVYPVGEANPTTISTFLRSVVPNARVTVDDSSGNLLAWATPTDHLVIKSTLEEMIKQAGEGAGKVVIYDVESTGGVSAWYIMREAFPRMTFRYSTTDATKLIAWGTEPDHAKVKELIDQLESQASRKLGFELKVYDVESIGSSRAIQMLTSVVPKAKLTTGSDPDKLVVWAKPEDHTVIEKLVSELPPPDEKTSKIYRLTNAEPRSVYTILLTLVPEARVTYDLLNRSVIVSAVAKDHEKVQQAIEEIERQDAEHTPTLVVYPVEGGDPQTIVTFLKSVVPNAKVTVDDTTGGLMAWASPADHATIKTTIDSMIKHAGEEATSVIVYDVENVGAVAAYYMMRRAFPRMQFNYSTRNPSRLIAWGTAADHKLAKQLIEQMEEEYSLKSGLELQVYDVESIGAAEAQKLLEDIVHEAEFTIGDDPNKLIVWAKPEDHVVIEKVVTQLPKPLETTTRIYYFRRADPKAAHDVLEKLAPAAEMAVDDDNRSIVVTANADDHAKLKKAVEEMDKEDPNAPTPQLQVHRFASADPLDVYNALRMLYQRRRDVHVSLDTYNDTLLAVAPPDEQERIRKLIADVEAAGDQLRKDMTVKVYDLEAVGARDTRELLERSVPKAEFTIGEDPNKLIARAKPQDHVLIAQIIKELPELPEMTSRVYYFSKSDPRAAQDVLERMTPRAEMAVDRENNSLIVSATAEDHAKIETAVQDMEKDHPNDPTPRVHTYRLDKADPSNAYLVLRTLFRDDRNVQLTVDRNTDTLIAVAPQKEHEKIRELIKSIEEAGTTEGPEKLEFYPVENVDTSAVLSLIEELLREHGSKAHVSLAPYSQQLVVRARPEIHDMVREAIEGFRSEKPVVEVYQLEFIDPLSAQMAIGRLFTVKAGQPMPVIDYDLSTQRLYVRAIEEQQQDIRDLLVKMGEEGLSVRRSPGAGTGRLRTVPFDGNVNLAIEEIQRIWSQLRSNPIQVVTPPKGLIPSTDQSPQEPTRRPCTKPQPKPNGDKPSAEKSTKDGETAKSKPAKREQASRPRLNWENALVEAGMSDTGRAIRDALSLNDNAENAKAEMKTEPTDSPASAETDTTPPPPVVVVPGVDSVTISCDDPEALNQFETLLRALSGQAGLVGRNLMLIPLRNVAATMVAETLNQLFRNTSRTISTVSTGPVTVVADERLNAVIVHANRADRAMIQSLVQALDTAEIPDSLAIKRPMIVPVKNTDAHRIEDVIQNIYRTHLTTRSSTRPMPIPRGLPSQLAGALQQMNAATAGPLLTIDVEEKSNSLVLMGPSQLLDEIKMLIDELDRAALDDRANKITVIPLKKVNSQRVREALQLFRGGSSYGRSGSRYSRSSSGR